MRISLAKRAMFVSATLKSQQQNIATTTANYNYYYYYY